MVIVLLFMLLVPGLIAVRIHWSGREITGKDVAFLVSDYLIYSFLIMLFDYAVMFFTYPERSVSFSVRVFQTVSHIYQSSFVFKYSFIALALSLALPYIWKAVHRKRPKR